MDSAALNSALDSIFNPASGAWAAVILLMSAALWRRCPDTRGILRNTLLFLVISFIGLKLTHPANPVAGGDEASILHAIFLLCVGAAFIRLMGLFIFRIVLAALRITPPSILEQILVVVAYFIWAMLELHAAGVPLGEIITTSAIATAVLAFAMQDTLGNILGGLALQWDHSLKVGDWIHIDNMEGKVVDIKWRAIKMETRDWETVVIPNAVMMKNQFMVLGERTNESTKWRRRIRFKVDYSVSPDRVLALADQAVRTADIPLVAKIPPARTVLYDIEDSVATYLLVFWLEDPAVDAPTCSAVRQHIFAALRRDNIRLGMPKRHFYLTNKDEAYLEHKHLNEVAHRVQAISEIDLFQSFSAEELQILANNMEHRPYAEGDVIFQQGDLDFCLYIITAGEVGIYLENSEGQENYAFSLQPGEILGEVGLMTGEPRGATARAATAVNCYVLGKQDFADIMLSREGMIEEISQVVASRQGALQRAREVVHKVEEKQRPHTLHELTGKIRMFLSAPAD